MSSKRVDAHRPLYLLGCGGHAKVVLDLVLSSGGVVDGVCVEELPEGAGQWRGVRIIGDDETVLELDPQNASLVNGLGFLGGINRREIPEGRFLVPRFRASNGDCLPLLRDRTWLADYGRRCFASRFARWFQLDSEYCGECGSRLRRWGPLSYRTRCDALRRSYNRTFFLRREWGDSRAWCENRWHVLRRGGSCRHQGCCRRYPCDGCPRTIGTERMSDSSSNQPWRETLVSEGSSLRKVIRTLDHSGLQIVLVASDDGELRGTVTDGDIRRALLRGAALDDVVDGIMVRKPMVVPPEMSREMVLHLMRANKIHQVPVVDSEGRLVGLHVWDDVAEPTARDNFLVIMAGGLGTRLRPLTERTPKPMINVAGKPMLEHIVERARSDGFRKFVFSINYLGDHIENYFGDGSRWKVEISYVREHQPLGTAGALSLLDPEPRLPFIVTNGDVLTEIRYGELLDFHCVHKAMATMAVRQHEWQHPFGVVVTNGIDVVGLEEKPIYRTHINAGIYVLEPRVLEFLVPGGRCDMPELFEKVRSASNTTIAFPLHEPWLDIGRPQDLAMAEDSIKD